MRLSSNESRWGGEQEWLLPSQRAPGTRDEKEGRLQWPQMVVRTEMPQTLDQAQWPQ